MKFQPVKELIDMLDVKGMIITADAMHCQKETAERIVNNGGDYVLQLKAIKKVFMKMYMHCLMTNIWMKQIKIVNMNIQNGRKKVMEGLKEEHVMC